MFVWQHITVQKKRNKNRIDKLWDGYKYKYEFLYVLCLLISGDLLHVQKSKLIQPFTISCLNVWEKNTPQYLLNQPHISTQPQNCNTYYKSAYRLQSTYSY